MYQAGTLSGNPLAMTAGLETLRAIQQPGVWAGLEERGAQLIDGLGTAAEAAGVRVFLSRVGTMFGMFFQEGPVTDWTSASASDTERFGRYFHAMLEQGVYVAPSQFEGGFISTAHGEEEIGATVDAAAAAFKTLL
jgi:glutamate-1-semialdehyde 2,1-aminomutase